MVTFRKSLLLIAIITAMAVAGYGQVQSPTTMQCNATAGNPATIRAEGLAELVGDVTIRCRFGTPTNPAVNVPKYNIRVFLNTTVTSRLLDSPWNEALLLMDEPAPGTQQLCTEEGGCTVTGIGEEPGVDYSSTYNVWQGRQILNNVNSSGNTVEWSGIPIDPPGTVEERVLRLTNIRVNAAERGVGAGLIPSQVSLAISITPQQGLELENDVLTVGVIQDGLNFSADSNKFLQCEGPDIDGNPISITFEERFGAAFKVRNVATLADSPTALAAQDIPGFGYGTETGYYYSGLSNVHGASVAGLASQGTQLVATFQGIPDGVSLFVSQRNSTSDTDKATLVSGGAPLSYSSATGESQVSLSGGAGSAVWEIVEAQTAITDDVNFTVRVSYTPNTSAGIPALGVGTVSGSYGPVSDIIVATSANLQPRFIPEDDAYDLLEIISCSTNLLWPYVTNQGGFDSGLVISNTSMDPGPWVTPQEGTCFIHYYGNANGGAPPAMDTTPIIGAGGHAAWTLSSGGFVANFGEPAGDQLIAAAPGFQGYVIAQCMFQYAHGYAFLSDLGAQNLAQGYIALILDDQIDGCNFTGSVSESGFATLSGRCGSNRTGSKSEALNQ
jgi:hypothetical protein